MLRSFSAIGAAFLLAACSSGTSSDGTSGGGDAANTAAVQENVKALCADGTLSFCDELTQATNGGPDVAVSGPLLIVGIHASAEADADTICHDLAAFHFDADAKDLGYTHVTVISGGSSVASCEIPS
jgi:hypothetical protein